MLKESEIYDILHNCNSLLEINRESARLAKSGECKSQDLNKVRKRVAEELTMKGSPYKKVELVDIPRNPETPIVLIGLGEVMAIVQGE